MERSKLDPVPALALGTSDVTLLEMVASYATIAREGQAHAPIFVKRIVDRNGKVLADFGAPARRALDADVALDLTDMLRGVVARGTGTQIKSRFGITADVAGKTGTTQNNTDGWFILMQPQLVAGAWVGFNDSRVTLRSNHWGQGGHNAILLVGDFYREAFKAKALDTKAKFGPPRHPAQPPLPVASPTLPPHGPPGWDGGIAGDELAASRTNGPAPAPAYVTAPRARANAIERSTRDAQDGDDAPAERTAPPRWQSAIPVPRPRSGRDRDDAFEPDAGRRDGAELLRQVPDADIDFERRERWRAPATRSSFGIAPASRSGPPTE